MDIPTITNEQRYAFSKIKWLSIYTIITTACITLYILTTYRPNNNTRMDNVINLMKLKYNTDSVQPVAFIALSIAIVMFGVMIVATIYAYCKSNHFKKTYTHLA